MTSPLSKFVQMLVEAKDRTIADYEDIVMAAELVSNRPNYLVMDEPGQYHAQASGSLDEVIRALEYHLAKLKKIKEQEKNEPTN